MYEKRNGLRILVVSPWGAEGGYSGPVTLQGRMFGTLVQDHGVDVHLVYRERDEETMPNWAAKKTALIKTNNASFSPAFQLLWAARLYAYLLRWSNHYDLIHFQGAYMPNILGALSLRAKTAFVLMPVLENGDLKLSGSPLVRRFKKLIYRSVVAKASLGLALSTGISAELTNLGMPSDRIQTINNIVDVNKFKRSTKSTFMPQDEIRIGFVGKLNSKKRPDLVLEAIQKLRARGINARGVFVGPFESQVFENSFRRSVAALGVAESVEITGFVTDPSEYMNDRMDIFVLPSSAEGLPGALVEAMSSGLPSIVTDVGGMKKVVVDAEAGIIVAQTSDSIVSAILSFQLDPAQWKRMSKAAREFASSNFTSEMMANQYIAQIDRLAVI